MTAGSLEKEFATYFAGPWKGAAIKIQVGEIQPVAPDIAVGELPLPSGSAR